MALILEGKSVAQAIREDVRAEVAELTRRGIMPRLQVALVGDNPASQSYVRGKEKACAEVGIASDTARLPTTTTQDELLELIRRWNQDPKTHAILVQLPLPGQISPDTVLAALDPRKDVDGLNPYNLGRIIASEPWFYPATPSGVLEIMRRYGIIYAGRHVVIVGRSELVGKPLANMLLQKRETGSATVTVCHSQTPDIGAFTRQADVIVAAVGKPGLITAEMVKHGVVVIDVGMNRIAEGTSTKLVGDVDFPAVSRVASAITPVPGGVGLMTVAMLLKNTVKAAKINSM